MRGKWKQWHFISLGSKITANGDYIHNIKRCLFFARKAVSNLDSIWKSRDISSSTKVHLVKAMVFPVVMYGCERWTVKRAECQRIVFKLWCWRRLLRVPWTARISNQSILKLINSEYSLEGLKLTLNTLATWCEELTHWKKPWSRENWGQEVKVVTENKMVGWHHWLSER